MSRGHSGGGQAASHWRLLVDHGSVTSDVLGWQYEGNGTKCDPFVVTWLDADPRNPLTWSKPYKWMITLTMASATLAVSFCSSAFSGGLPLPSPRIATHKEEGKVIG